MFDEATTNVEPRNFDQLPVLSKEAEEIRWFLLPNEAQEYLMGRTTTLTSRSFQPKLYPQRSLQPGDESSPRPESRAAGATGPHRGRFYKIVPSSPTPADSASDDSCGDVSRHKGSFMAEVCPAGKDKGGISLALSLIHI